MKKSPEIVKEIIDLTRQYFEESNLYRIKLSGPFDKSSEITEIYARPVLIKNRKILQYTFRYTNKDITKNLEISDALKELESFLKLYRNVSVQSDSLIHQLNPQKHRLDVSSKSQTSAINLSNNRVKKKLISEDRPFLVQLGITSSKGKVYASKQSKYRQINKYLELIEPLIKKSNFNDTVKIIDMGCGKGYLTFSLYDYLVNNLKMNVDIIGVDIREAMMDQCNLIANDLKYNGLKFKGVSIEESDHQADVLIALHACDTATDDAIISGLKAESKLIICSPCCHKQVRHSMESTNEIKSIIGHGILKERLAEILTDTIRSLILEAHGYKTQIMEFIATTHTPKNLLITAIKTDNPRSKNDCLEEIETLKEQYGISEHYLERVFSINE